MLQKRRDLGSLPDGLGVTATDMTKGTAVVRKIVAGKVTYAVPSTAQEAENVYGFITLRIDENDHPDKFYDTIKAGKKATVYTWVKNNEWAVSTFVAGTYNVGDKCSISYTGEDAGKVKLAGTDTATLEVVAFSPAMSGYADALLTVKVL